METAQDTKQQPREAVTPHVYRMEIWAMTLACWNCSAPMRVTEVTHAQDIIKIMRGETIEATCNKCEAGINITPSRIVKPRIVTK